MMRWHDHTPENIAGETWAMVTLECEDCGRIMLREEHIVWWRSGLQVHTSQCPHCGTVCERESERC